MNRVGWIDSNFFGPCFLSRCQEGRGGDLSGVISVKMDPKRGPQGGNPKVNGGTEWRRSEWDRSGGEESRLIFFVS